MDFKRTRRCTPPFFFLLSVLALTVSPAVDGAGLQNGFNYTNHNLTSGRLSVSFSGHFADAENPVCLLPTEARRIWPGETLRVRPPAGFTVSDVILFWTRRLPVTDENGNFEYDEQGRLRFREGPTRISNIDDPPGADLRAYELHSSKQQPVYNYLYIGPDARIGPAVTTVPLVVNGAQDNGIPKLYVAELDEKTGRPVLNQGQGHCFVPSGERANDPDSGEIFDRYLYKGETVTEARIDPVPQLQKPGPRRNNAWLIALLFIAVAVVVFAMFRRAKRQM